MIDLFKAVDTLKLNPDDRHNGGKYVCFVFRSSRYAKVSTGVVSEEGMRTW